MIKGSAIRRPDHPIEPLALAGWAGSEAVPLNTLMHRSIDHRRITGLATAHDPENPLTSTP